MKDVSALQRAENLSAVARASGRTASRDNGDFAVQMGAQRAAFEQRTAVEQALNPDLLRPRILLADAVGPRALLLHQCGVERVHGQAELARESHDHERTVVNMARRPRVRHSRCRSRSVEVGGSGSPPRR